MLSGLFVGMVLALTGIDLLARFGSEDVLGVAAALGLLKELGPVVTALLFAGRAGTSLTSEIGLMRATDQLTAMEMMAKKKKRKGKKKGKEGKGKGGKKKGEEKSVDPMRYVAAPRFIGGIIAMPLLVAIFDIVGSFRCPARRRADDDVNAGTFWSQTQGAVHLDDVTEGIIKSLAFGFVCTLIAVYEGYNAAPTAEGVGLATTRTVVASAVLTLIVDHAPDRCLFCNRGTFMRSTGNLKVGTGPVRAAGIRSAGVSDYEAAVQRAQARRLEGRLSRAGEVRQLLGDLAPGAPVSMAGVNVGEVEAIQFDPKGLQAAVARCASACAQPDSGRWRCEHPDPGPAGRQGDHRHRSRRLGHVPKGRQHDSRSRSRPSCSKSS